MHALAETAHLLEEVCEAGRHNFRGGGRGLAAVAGSEGTHVFPERLLREATTTWSENVQTPGVRPQPAFKFQQDRLCIRTV